MPHSHPLARPFLAPPRTLPTRECGHDLCAFVSTAASHIMRTLQRPCRSRPSKRKVNHRRFLQNQICRSFSAIEAATRHLASSILSQEAQAPPPVSQAVNPPKSHIPHPALGPPGSFSGIAEAFVAPDLSPSWALSLDSLRSDPGELFQPIANETDSWGLFSPDLLGKSNWLGCDMQPNPQSQAGCAVWGTSIDPNICLPVTAECPTPASDPGAPAISAHDTCLPFWELEMW
uniref:Uncharacterized protein n=1 Tax=Varanus komodoensis TaxID=61221 RepID=A0A8D2KUB0_VARKO